jgi:putative transposase
MKEAYAVRRTVPPSAEIEARIEHMLSVGVGENPRESLSELAKLGARLIIQRAVEEEFDAWLGRARYERRPADQFEECGEEAGLRNGFRPRRLQTAEGELEIEIPQVRQAAETFASKLFPRTPKLVRTEPLKALVIGAFVRGLSMRDVESLCEEAGLGKLSKATASRMCEELKERFERFRRRDLYEIRLVALFLDATFIAVRADGPKEGVQVAWGFTEDGERILLAVSLGMRESFEDWQTPSPRPDRPWAGGADADRRRRRARPDQGDRAMLAGVRPPTLRCSPRPQPLRQTPRPRTRTHQARLLASPR